MKARAQIATGLSKPLEERECPLGCPGPGEIVIKMEMAGVCSSDPHITREHHPMSWNALSFTLGYENVGRVQVTRRAGHDAPREGGVITRQRSLTCGTCYCRTDRKPWLCGDRVAYSVNRSDAGPPHLGRGYAEYVRLDAGKPVVKIPDGSPPEQFVAAGCTADTAMHATEVARMGLGEDVVILGCGYVGLCAIACASASGTRSVTAPDLVATRPELTRDFSATATLDVSRMTPKERLDVARSLTGGFGASKGVRVPPEKPQEGLCSPGVTPGTSPGFGHDGGTEFETSGWCDIASNEIELVGCFARATATCPSISQRGLNARSRDS